MKTERERERGLKVAVFKEKGLSFSLWYHHGERSRERRKKVWLALIRKFHYEVCAYCSMKGEGRFYA